MARNGASTIVIAMAVFGFAAAIGADQVTDWNATTVDAVLIAAKTPPAQGRILAMVHAAAHDAVNCINARYEPYALRCEPVTFASVDAAVASAARDVLVAELPAQQATFDAQYTVALSSIPDGAAKSAGIDIGRLSAATTLALRASDGSTIVVPYVPGSGPGFWQRTPPAFAAPSVPGFALVTPFVLKSGSQFRPVPPPDLLSDVYTADYLEVKSIGAAGSSTRSAEQTEIGRFHFESSNVVWNRIARAFAPEHELDTWERARMFALLNLALADAFIAGWDAKFYYNYWRPVTAIRAADSDGNPATETDPAWLPLLNTPAHPDYPSTHSLASGAAAEVLERFFGTRDLPFSTTSTTLPGVTRSFVSPSQAASEISDSRVYAGIHFRTACATGVRVGRQVGHFAYTHALKPLKPAVKQAAKTIEWNARDPLHLSFSTFIGGTATEVANALAVDSEGNMYVIGRTESDDFPTTTSFQTVRRGGRDIFVAKFNDDGSTLIYSTYIGGAADENPLGIIVDEEGNAFITGVTSSIDFPTRNAAQPNYGGGAQDGFVLKLDATGSSLIYATFLGGSELNQSRCIAVDTTGSAYVTGNTPSDGFPTKNSLQSYGGGVSDAFVTKLSPDGQELVYSTFLGGSALESGRGIRVDGEGAVYVAGETRSLNFPATPGAFQTAYGGGLDDLFVVKLSPEGNQLRYATYLGGSASDQGQSSIGGSSTIHGRIIAVDEIGSAFVTGDTASPNFPLKAAFQPLYGGGAQDAFVAKLAADGSSLIYSSFLGGSGLDTGRSIAIDNSGRAIITGGTSSIDLLTVNAPQPEFGGGDFDAFVAAVSPAGDTLEMLTYLGGTGTDAGWDVVVGPSGKHLHVVGQTSSADFPTHEAQQATIGGSIDGFACKLKLR